MRTITSIGFAMGDQALVSGVNFLTLVVAGKCLGMEGFGVFSLVWAALIFISNLHQALALAPLAVFMQDIEGAAAARYARSLDRIHLLPGATVVAGGILGLTAVGPARTLGLGVFLMGARLLGEFQRRLAYSLRRPGMALAIDLTGTAPLLALWIWWVIRPTPLILADLFLLVGLAALFSWLAGWLVFLPLRWSAAGATEPWRGRHWRFGRWLFASVFTNWTANQLYLFLTAGLVGLGQAAWFNGARSILGTTNVVMGGFDAYYLPHLRRRMLEQGRVDRRDLLRNAIFCGLFVVPICLACIAMPASLLIWIYHEGYRGAAPVLQVLGLAYLVLFANRIFALILQARQRTAVIFWAYLISSVATILLGPWLLMRHQALGGAMGYGLNNLIVAVIMIRGLRRPAGNEVES